MEGWGLLHPLPSLPDDPHLGDHPVAVVEDGRGQVPGTEEALEVADRLAHKGTDLRQLMRGVEGIQISVVAGTTVTCQYTHQLHYPWNTF